MVFETLTVQRESRIRGGLVICSIAWVTGCGDSMTMVEPAPSPNRPPMAVGTLPPTTLAIGESVSLNVSSYFQDPDGDPLTLRAESTDPSRVRADISGTDLMTVGIAGGTATVTVIATDPGRLIAAQSGAVTVRAENRAPMTVGPFPRQTMDAGTSLTVDVSPYFSDPDGDVLSYEATSNKTDVVTTDVSGSVVTINAVADGTATVSVSATDPDGLSAAQQIEVVVGAESGDFRDDFDSDALEGWSLTNAGTALSEGVLQLANTSSGLPGQAARTPTADLLDWEIRASVGRIHDDVGARVVAYTGFAQFPAFALEIGADYERGGQDTNFRVLVLQAGGGQGRWLPINAGHLDAVSDSAGAFTEISLSMTGTLLSASVGDSTVHAENLAGAPISMRTLIRAGLWAVPFEDEVERTALFDWIEVTGEASSAFLPTASPLRRNRSTATDRD